MPTNIKKYEIVIKGTTPVIWNRMKKEIEEEKKKLKKNELSEYEEKYWLKKAETNNGNALIPNSWLKSVLINSCKQTGINPHYASSKKETYTRYMQSVLIPPAPPIIVSKTKELIQHSGYYPAQGAKGGGKVWRVFPMLEQWKAKFQLIDPFGRMRKEELRELLEYGGMFIGIGDQRNMNFGRFEVVSIESI